MFQTNNFNIEFISKNCHFRRDENVRITFKIYIKCKMINQHQPREATEKLGWGCEENVIGKRYTTTLLMETQNIYVGKD